MSFAAARRTFETLTKRQRTGLAPEGSSDSEGGASGAGAASGGSSSQAQLTAAPQSFASVARAGNKRSTPAPPTFPRPQLERGAHIFKHADYDSMERPAPKSASPTVLYVDMRHSSLSPDEALDAAYTTVGDAAVGFQVFSAQKTLALVFLDAEHATPHRDRPLGDTGLTLYAAPPKTTQLVKLTLQGVPVHDVPALQNALVSLLQPYGDLVFLAPMVHAKTKWYSDQWHATLRVRDGEELTLPDPVVTIMGAPVIIDVPGERRFCRHCMDVTHSRADCRQGQRLRAKQQQLLRQQQQHQQQLQQQPLDQQQESAFGSGYVAPPKRSAATATDEDSADTASVRSRAAHRWDDNMETESPEIVSPEQLVEMERTAQQIVNHARLRPSEVDSAAVVNAQRFLDTLAAQRSRGSGDQ